MGYRSNQPLGKTKQILKITLWALFVLLKWVFFFVCVFVFGLFIIYLLIYFFAKGYLYKKVLPLGFYSPQPLHCFKIKMVKWSNVWNPLYEIYNQSSCPVQQKEK